MEFAGYLRFILALVFVLALIGVIAALARRFGLGYRNVPKKGRRRRLSIVEVMPVDAKRRLVLFRRDATEHLVLMGSNNDLVIEADIPAPAESAFAAALENQRRQTPDTEQKT